MKVLMRPKQWRIITAASPGVRPGGCPSSWRRWYDDRHRRHAHPQREILVSLTGRDFYGLGDSLYPMQPGTVIFFDTLTPHEIGYPPFAQPQDHLWINLLPDQFIARVLNIRQGRAHVQTATSVLLDAEDVGLRITDRTVGAVLSPSLPSELRDTRLLALVAGIAATLLERGFQPAPAIPSRLADPERVMASLMEHLRETAGRGDSLESLARIAGYSPFHFLRLFRRMTGCTVHRYIDQCRRRRVRELDLRNWSQKAIAAELGFSTPQSFCRWNRRQPVSHALHAELA